MVEDRADAGLRIRKEVLGAEYVARAMANVDDFSAPMSELVNEYCWGWLWSRDDIPRQTRSLLNIVILSVLNRPTELKTHVKAALKNGCSREEVRASLLQVAVYAGVPCGVDSFRVAKEAILEFEAEG